jgi:hypothetical protein
MVSCQAVFILLPSDEGELKKYLWVKDRRKGKRIRIKLPRVRDLARSLHSTTKEIPKSEQTTHMLMQWGQFLDHDITLTPNRELRCCQTIFKNDPVCARIMIGRHRKESDPIFKFENKHQACIPFTRSTADCSVGEGGAPSPLSCVLQ